MAAHLRPLPKCQRPGCDRPATREMFNSRNAPMGRYCDRHAKVALAEWLKKHPDEAPSW